MFVTELNDNVDFTNICRLCLNQNNKLISLFDSSIFQLQYLEIINECTDLTILKNDKLPKNLCLECVECLNKFYQFRKLVVNSELRLNDFLNNFSNNFNKNMKIENTIYIKDEIDSNKEPICPIKSEEELHDFEEDSDVGEEIDEHKLPIILSFPIKSEESQILENYEKINHDTSSSHLSIDKKSNKKSEKLHICKQCDKAFNKKSRLQLHEVTHSGEKSYRCKWCKKCFSQLVNLNTHERIHTGENLYICKQCNRSFRLKRNLKHHERTHTGEKPYNCDQCEKSFSQSSNLTRHKRIHTGERPYRCNECGISFNQSGCLRVHEKIHTGERSYNCNQCEKSFTQLGNLRTHEKTHTGEKR